MVSDIPAGELGGEKIIGLLENNIALRAQRYLEEIGAPPTLSIISANPDDDPSQRYMKLKKNVGAKLGIEVNPVMLDSLDDVRARIEEDNVIAAVNGTIIQLPLQSRHRGLTDEILALVKPEKDVDGLGPESPFVPATVRAVEAWLEGHDINYLEEDIVLMGLGILVNLPFYKRLLARGATSVQAFQEGDDDLEKVAAMDRATIIVSAMGRAGLLKPSMFVPGTCRKVLVDVGTSEQNGAQQGDVSDELRVNALEAEWALPPKIGGIGKITVRVLMANLMDAAEAQVGIDEPIGSYRMRLSLAATSPNRPFVTTAIGSRPPYGDSYWDATR